MSQIFLPGLVSCLRRSAVSQTALTIPDLSWAADNRERNAIWWIWTHLNSFWWNAESRLQWTTHLPTVTEFTDLCSDHCFGALRVTCATASASNHKPGNCRLTYHCEKVLPLPQLGWNISNVPENIAWANVPIIKPCLLKIDGNTWSRRSVCNAYYQITTWNTATTKRRTTNLEISPITLLTGILHQRKLKLAHPAALSLSKSYSWEQDEPISHPKP
jgi:hypothetical protein